MIGGKYTCERVLGSGGMGVVIEARHAQLGQRVAVKVLLPAALKDPVAAERFLREARAVIAIKSDHVARVMDFGTLESGSPYLVMEHLDGDDLKQLLLRDAPLPISAVADYAIQACEALFEAHQRGVVHRDLKPANLFVTSRVDGTPHVKVLDFGISKTGGPDASSSGPDPSITKTDAVFGTPAYMSPEQLRSSKQVDHRTDIWSMGVTLYELMAGRLPFGGPGDGVMTMVAHILEDTPPKLQLLRSEVPDALDAVVARCLAKSPADRFQSAAELAQALAAFATAESSGTLSRIARMSIDSLPFEATVRSHSGALSGPAGRPVSSGWGRTDGKTTRQARKTGAVVAVAAVLIAAIGAGWVLGTRSSQPPQGAISAPTPDSSSSAAALQPSTVAPPAASVLTSAQPSSSAVVTADSASPIGRASASPRVTSPAVASKADSAMSPAPEPPKCDPGRVMTNGHCCRAGFEWKGGDCVPGVAKGLQ